MDGSKSQLDDVCRISNVLYEIASQEHDLLTTDVVMWSDSDFQIEVYNKKHQRNEDGKYVTWKESWIYWSGRGGKRWLACKENGDERFSIVEKDKLDIEHQ